MNILKDLFTIALFIQVIVIVPIGVALITVS